MKRKTRRLLFALAFFCIAFLISSSDLVRAEGLVRIDANKKYKGMNASFAKGYMPQIQKNAMQLVIPFRTDKAVEGNRILVGVSFDREENSPFLFQNYQKQVKKQKNGVYLYKCKIKLKENRVNGQYPLRLFVLAETAEGTAREEFTVYTEISDGKAAAGFGEEMTENETSLKEGWTDRTGTSGTEEEIVRQPKVMIGQNSLQGESIAAGSSAVWKLTVKNCSGDQTVENMKVTMTFENKEILFEKHAWYFEKTEAGKEMDLSQNITVGKKALAESMPVSFQFDYEDKKGTAYSSSETVYLSVSQTQQAELAGFQMPESFYESDTEAVSFQAINTGLAVLYNAKVRLEGKGLSADEIFLGNIEAGTSQDAEMQIFAGTLNMDADGETADEYAEKYGEVSGRVVLSYENEQGNVTELEQTFLTEIKKPQIVELNIEEEEPETNQWWITITAMFLIVLLLVILWLYLRMKHYQRIGREIYEKTKYL